MLPLFGEFSDLLHGLIQFFVNYCLTRHYLRKLFVDLSPVFQVSGDLGSLRLDGHFEQFDLLGQLKILINLLFVLIFEFYCTLPKFLSIDVVI